MCVKAGAAGSGFWLWSRSKESVVARGKPKEAPCKPSHSSLLQGLTRWKSSGGKTKEESEISRKSSGEWVQVRTPEAGRGSLPSKVPVLGHWVAHIFAGIFPKEILNNQVPAYTYFVLCTFLKLVSTIFHYKFIQL